MSRPLPAAMEQSTEAAAAPGRAARLWARVRRPVLWLAAVALLGLIAWRARDIDWAAAWQALRSYRLPTLALAALLAIAAHAAYTSFDLLGRRYTGHRLPLHRVAATAFVSFTANLNLGSLVGGVALRYRLYSRQGLAAGTITRVLGFSLATNWIGYAALAGSMFSLGLVRLPAGAPLSGDMLRLLGLALWAVVALYLAACRWSPRREWTLRGQRLELPRARLALAQVMLSMVHWSLIAAVLTVLLRGAVDYPTVLGVLMLGSLAGVATHIPAGLGVLEAVFLSLLAGHPQAQLLAGLLAYRALFYLAPLGAAAALYVWLEAGTRHDPAGR